MIGLVSSSDYNSIGFGFCYGRPTPGLIFANGPIAFFGVKWFAVTFGDLFLDDNDVNEKAIIGFISFFLMVVFGITDLTTALVWDMDLKVSETIYTSFVVVTLGAFGISEAGKAFGK